MGEEGIRRDDQGRDGRQGDGAGGVRSAVEHRLVAGQFAGPDHVDDAGGAFFLRQGQADGSVQHDAEGRRRIAAPEQDIARRKGAFAAVGQKARAVRFRPLAEHGNVGDGPRKPVVHLPAGHRGPRLPVSIQERP